MGCVYSSSKSSDEDKPKPKPKPKGVSVYWLKHGFLQEVKDAGHKEQSKIYDIENLNETEHGVIRSKGTNIICPRDYRMGAAYVDCLDEEHVGESNVMLSYGWGNSCGDIVDALMDFCRQGQLNPKDTYVWICCLCNNQHRVAENKANGEDVTFEEFRDIFQNNVISIGHVVAMFSPWDKPVYLSRVWCIFELFTANEKGCDLTITMPPRDKTAMVEALEVEGGVNVLYDTLSGTKVESAQASEEEDRKRILKLVTDGPGYISLNNHVNTLVRNWVKTSILESVATYELDNFDNLASDKHYAHLCTCIGNIMEKNDENEEALALYTKALKVQQNLFGNNHEETAVSFNNIGSSYGNLNQLDKAIENYKISLAIKEKVLNENHPSCARTINNIGALLFKQGDYKSALEHHLRALEIRKIALFENHIHMAQSYNNIGLCYKRLGDNEEALVKFQKALEINIESQGEGHPDTAATFNNIAGCLETKGDPYGAIAEYKKALAIHKSLFGEDHPRTKAIEQNIEGTKKRHDITEDIKQGKTFDFNRNIMRATSEAFIFKESALDCREEDHSFPVQTAHYGIDEDPFDGYVTAIDHSFPKQIANYGIDEDAFRPNPNPK